jgi:hypothetical protein
LFQTPEKPKEPVIDQYKNPVMSLNELRPGLTYEVRYLHARIRTAGYKQKRIFFVRTIFSFQECVCRCFAKLFTEGFLRDVWIADSNSKNCRRKKETTVPVPT